MPTRMAALGVFGCLVGMFLASSRAEAQVAFAPVVQPFQNGVSLDVTPAVSHDRRYVRMSLNFQSTALEGFDRYSVPAAVGGTGGGGGGGGAGGLGSGGGGGGAAGGGGGRGVGALFDRPSGKSPWGNARPPIAIAKGPSLSLDLPGDLPPPTPPTVAAAAPRSTEPLLARASTTKRARLKANSRRGATSRP